MPIKPRRVPEYRLHKPTGLGVVRLDGRDIYVGKHGTPESIERYNRTIAEWLATKTNSSRQPNKVETEQSLLSVAELLLAFWKHAVQHYRDPDGAPSDELGNIKGAIKSTAALYGSRSAREFGPLALRSVRERMIADGLARTTVNARVNRIRRAFKWAAGLEMIPGSVVADLKSVEGLQRGRTQAREPEPVTPVSAEDVERTLPFLSGPVAGLVRFQLLTGCRPGEACNLRSRDIARSEETWTYRPAWHKTAWRGQSREIIIGPRCQELLAHFLKLDLNAYLFDPRDAVAEHHAKRAAERRSKPTPSEKAKRKLKPGKSHSRKYSVVSYRNAVIKACGRAGIAPWSPNQIRHKVASEIAHEYGLEAAQVVLGHARADVTQVYAKRNITKAREVIRIVG